MPGNTLGSNDVPLSLFGGLNTELSPADLPEGVSPDCQDVAFLPGSVFTRPALHKFYETPLPNNVAVNYVRSFIQDDGIPLTMFLGADGRLYEEDTINNPGTYSLLGTQPSGLLASSNTAFGKEFFTFHNGYHGQAIAKQYDGVNLDRVSQDGPGANPAIAVDLATTVTLQTLTQGNAGCNSLTENGNICTLGFVVPHGLLAAQKITVNQVFDGTGHELTGYEGTFIIASVPSSTSLTFVNSVTGLGAGVQANVFLDTAALIAAPPTGAVESGTTVTITTTIPHGLNVGQQITIFGVGVSGYNGTFTVLAVLNPTQFTYTTTGGLAASGGGGVATCLTNLTTVQPHGLTVGDPFIVSGLTGGNTWANGNWVVKDVLSPTTVTFIASSGFNLVVITTAVQVTTGGKITAGPHKFVVLFLTRNGHIPAPSPVVTWTCGGNKQVQITGIPIGPANVSARIIAFTPTDGDNFFYIPIDVDGGNSTVIPDNITTSFTFNFSDNTLMSSFAIDVDGNNQFNQVSLAPPAGGFVYADRTLWWGERNKVQNLVNMGFDGGSNQGVVLGWTVNTTGGTLVPGGDFGGAWSITGDGSNNFLGQVQQTAFQDQFGINILQPSTSYTFVCWASVPVLLSAGSIVATLSSVGTSFTSTATINCSTLTINGGFVQATFDTPTPLLIPSDLLLQVSTQNTADSTVVVLDELEIVPTLQPFADTRIRVSYVNNPEAFDDVTGLLIVGQSNGQPVRSLFTLRDNLYVVKSNSMYVTNDNGEEPSQWSISVVSNTVGALSCRAMDVGDDWAVIAHRSGLYLFNGSSPVKISQEIDSLWQRINWDFSNTVWVKVDPLFRRIYIGVPLDDATSPSALLVLDYRELNSATDIQSSGPIRTSYTGKMMATDLSRKWTIWNTSANCGDLLLRSNGLQEFALGSGNGSGLSGGFGNLYFLDPTLFTDDDYGQINSYYTTYFFINHEMEQQLQVGSHRKQYGYLTQFVSGVGNVTITPLVDQLANPKRPTAAKQLSSAPIRDLEWGLNVLGERVAFQIESSPIFGPNVISDSDGGNGTWIISGGGLNYNQTPVGALFPSGGWQFIGNGNPSSFSFAVSQILNVTGGMTYTLSGYIDATQVVAGPLLPIWEITDPPLLNTFASVQQQAGANGRVQVTFTVPTGVNQIVVIANTFNSTISNGGVLTFSNPQLELGNNATPWVLKNFDNAFNLNKLVVTIRQDPWSPVAGNGF